MRIILVALLVALPSYGYAQTADLSVVVKAEVVDIGVSGVRGNEGTSVSSEYQELTMRILEGERTGELIEFTNDSPLMLAVGERAFVRMTPTISGEDIYAVVDPDRLPALLILTTVFIAVSVLLGGMAGFRSVLSLSLSFAIIIFVLLPLLMNGAPPVLTSTLLASLMLALSMVITHGMKRKTWIALLGSLVALAIAVVVSLIAVEAARLSGFGSDEAVYLNFATGGTLNIAGLLLGGILIGIVGVLNDISVSQVHTVAELAEANRSLSRREVFTRAMRVGREHVGAVINTLPLAYAGAALPLLLLFSTTHSSIFLVINREVFASEVVRVLAGGIALSVSGAIATVLAVLVLIRHK